MPEVKRRNERLVVLLVLGFIALNYPLLSLFSKVRLFFGIPVLYLYIFTVWSLFILCMALVLEKRAFPSMTSSPPRSGKAE
ncbi:MAG: hypothetical protein M8357_16005 [Desulfobulbaceae bacterium]|nr:hypothetical protein [Desulfobulbaceae bacterium]